MLRHFAAFGGFAALASFGHLARASATQLTYQAPESCPSGSEFLAALKQRGVEAQLAAAPHTLVVSIERTGSGFTGRLKVEDEQGPTQAREASARTCAEVADAMAAVGALILAPPRSETETTATSETPDATLSTTSEAAPSVAQPSVTQPNAPKPSAPKPNEPPADTAPQAFRGASTMGSDSRHWKRDVSTGTVHYDLQTALSLNAGATLGLLPGVWVPRLDLTAVTAPFLTLPGGEQSILGVMPRIRVGVLGPVSTDISGQRVALRGFDFQMGLCFSPHYDSSGWVLYGCAEYGGSMLIVDIGSGEDRSTIEGGYANVGLDFTAQYNFTSWLNAGLRVGSQVFGGRKEIPLGDGLGQFDLGGPATLSASGSLGINF